MKDVRRLESKSREEEAAQQWTVRENLSGELAIDYSTNASTICVDGVVGFCLRVRVGMAPAECSRHPSRLARYSGRR